MSANWDEAVAFSFKNDIKEAKVLSVYDGDTITVAFPFGDKMFRWNCRLIGVDTPELRTRNKQEKEFGYQVRDHLREKILKQMVRIECDDFDKYGRLLVKVYKDDECVNDWLVDKGYAFAYDGGTKKKWFA